MDRNPAYLDHLNYEYNTLMSAMRVSVSKHLRDEEYTLIWANDYYYEMTLFSKAEYEAAYHNSVKAYFSVYAEEYDRLVETVVRALNEGASGYEMICRMPQKGGTFLWIRLVGVFTEEKIDGVPVIYTVFTDVTDLVQTQTEQSVTYDSLPGFAAKFRIGEKFEYLFGSEKFIKFFGKRSGNNDSLGNLDSEENESVIAEHLDDLRKGLPAKFVLRVKNLRDEDVWFQLSMTCIDWQNGFPVYLVIYIDITDITEQRELQKKLEERSEMLKGALEMAERANSAKSDFLSRMSHDIRTPMNAIIGMTHIAKENRNDPQRVLDCLEKVETSANFLLSLINDILDMSKIESGKMIVNKKKFDFGVFLRGIASLFFGECEKKRIAFNVHAEGRIEEFYVGDELKLNQILLNLLSNAVKFTPDGGTVDFTVRRGEQGGKFSELIFVVSDSGPGIETGFLDKLFVPFEQDKRSRSTSGGSGLGLAIANSYAKLMNGAIEVKSKLGEGSSFKVNVWLDGAEEDASQYVRSFDGTRVLVVDDDENVCEYAVDTIGRFCASAEAVRSGAKALQIIHEAENAAHPFNVIIVDWKMPEMDGIELTRRIRREFSEDMMIIAISAYDWGMIREEALTAGVNGFLPKPLFPSSIYDFLVTHAGESEPIAPTVSDSVFDGERILLVEDNDINMEIAKTLLESRNLLVDCAENGLEAVDKFRASSAGEYFAILMDIQMPVMNGLDATRHIRALNHPDAGTVPIVAMSANAFDEDVEKSFGAGMDGHITKPVNIKTLFETIRSFKRTGKHRSIERAVRDDSLKLDLVEFMKYAGVDSSATLERFSGNPNLYERFLKKYPSDPVMTKLRKAVENRNYPGIETHAHTIKGSVSNMGFDRLAKFASDLVESVRAGMFEDVPVLFERIEREYGMLVRAIERLG